MFELYLTLVLEGKRSIESIPDKYRLIVEKKIKELKNKVENNA